MTPEAPGNHLLLTKNIFKLNSLIYLDLKVYHKHITSSQYLRHFSDPTPVIMKHRGGSISGFRFGYLFKQRRKTLCCMISTYILFAYKFHQCVTLAVMAPVNVITNINIDIPFVKSFPSEILPTLSDWLIFFYISLSNMRFNISDGTSLCWSTSNGCANAVTGLTWKVRL